MRCSFTGKEIPKGTGIIYAKANGTVFYFINSKAKNNFLKLGRKGRDVKWTDLSREYRAETNKQSKKTVEKEAQPVEITKPTNTKPKAKAKK